MKDTIFGLIVGAAIGWAAHSLYFSKKLEAKMQVEEEALKNYYGEMLDELEKQKEQEKEEVKEEAVKSALVVANSSKPDIMEYKSRVEHVNYASRSKEKPKARVIDEEEYLDTQTNNVVLLTYYGGDQKLIEDVTEKEFDLRKVTGITLKEAVDSATEMGDMIYIRDDSNRTDYEITYTPESFGEEELDE